MIADPSGGPGLRCLLADGRRLAHLNTESFYFVDAGACSGAEQPTTDHRNCDEQGRSAPENPTQQRERTGLHPRGRTALSLPRSSSLVLARHNAACTTRGVATTWSADATYVHGQSEHGR